MIIREIEVSMPWGNVKGQIFEGDSLQHQHVKPILALHGYLDNSNSFRPIAQYLTKSNDYYIIAIDLPGHGFSSHMPTRIYNFKVFIICMRRVIKYFNLNSVNLLAHSFGCTLSLLYASCFPDEIDSIMLIDFALTYKNRMSTLIMPKLWNVGIDNLLEFEYDSQLQESNSNKVLTKELALEILLRANKNLDENAASILLERGLIERDGKLQFSRDIRAKNQVNAPDMYTDFHVVRDSLKSYLKCPLLFITCVPATFGEKSYERTIRFFLSLKHDHLIKHVKLEGNHHLHMIKPEPTANVILEFLNNNKKLLLKAKL